MCIRDSAIQRADAGDIAVNFIVLPQFFDEAFNLSLIHIFAGGTSELSSGLSLLAGQSAALQSGAGTIFDSLLSEIGRAHV